MLSLFCYCFQPASRLPPGRRNPMEQNTATPPKGGKAVRTILEWTEEIVLAVVLIAVVFTFV